MRPSLIAMAWPASVMPVLVPVLAMSVLASLAGCAAPAAKPAQPAAASPSAPVVDGSYNGPSRLMMAETRGCPRSGTQSVTVFDRGFDVRYREGAGPLVPVHAVIAADNTVQGDDGMVQIGGTLQNQILNLTVRNATCETHMVLRRR